MFEEQKEAYSAWAEGNQGVLWADEVKVGARGQIMLSLQTIEKSLVFIL